MSRFSQKFFSIIFTSFVFLFSFGVVSALPNWYSGFKSKLNDTVRVDLRGAYTDCKNVSSSGSKDLFIPTRYLVEWQAFKANSLSYLSLGNCTEGEYIMGLGKKWKNNELSGEEANFAANFTTTDGSGNLYVIDVQEDGSNDTIQRVLKFSSTGQLLLIIGGQNGDNNLSGTSAELNRPLFVNVDPEGNIYIIDSVNYKVKKYSSTGAWLLTVGSTRGDSELGGTNTQLYAPAYVGNFLSGSFSVIDYFGFADQNMLKVKTFSSTGAYIGGFGKLYGDNNLSGESAQLNNGLFQGVDSSGNVIIVDAGNNKIKKYSSTGSWLLTISGSFDYNDMGLVYKYLNKSTKSRDGSVYLLRDCAGKCLKVFSQTGGLITQIGTYAYESRQVNNLGGVDAIPTGSFLYDVYAYSGGIYIQGETQIKKYSLTGAWLFNIGPSTYPSSTVDNQLDGEDAGFPIYSYKMTVDTYGNVYVFVVDPWGLGIAKIKKYSSTGAWLMDIGGPAGDNDLSGEDAQITDYYNGEMIDVDNDGNIYVRADRLKKYSSTGAWLLTLGNGVTSNNNLDGRSAGLSYAGRFLVDNSGSIYVHNSYFYFKKYTSTGAWLYNVGAGGPGENNLSYESAGFGYSELGGIDRENNIYLNDFNPGKIKVYSSTGVWQMTIGDSSYFGGNDLSGTGAHLSGPPLLNSYYLGSYNNRPYNFVDENGNFYFLDGTGVFPNNGYKCSGDQMRKYSSTGAFLLRIGDAWLRGNSNNNSDTSANFQSWGCYSKGMVVDHSGSIWLGNGSYYMKKYSSTGAFIVTVGSERSGTPEEGDNDLSGNAALFRGTNIGVTVDNQNSLYIHDAYNKKIKKYSSTGAWMMTLGSGIGGENNSGSSEAQWYYYYPPFPPTMDVSGNIYVRNHYYTYPQSFDRLKKYSATGAWQFNLGTFIIDNNLSGTSALLSIDPYGGGIMTDNSGNIWINATSSYYVNYDTVYVPRIKKYSATGAHLLTLGNGVMGDNQLDAENAEFLNPNILKLMDSGEVYILDFYTDTSKIKKYSSTGTWLSEFVFDRLCASQYPSVNDSGEVFGYDCITGEYQIYNPDGSLSTSFSSDPNSSIQLLDNYYYVISNYNTLYKYDNLGNLILTIGQGIDGDNDLSGTAALLNGIYNLSLGGNDSIYLVGSTFIKKYDSDGNHIFTKNLSTPYPYIEIGSNDSLYYFSDNSVEKYDTNGNLIFTKSYGSGLTSGEKDSSDNVYLYGESLIEKYDSGGNIIFTLGQGIPGDNNLSGTAALFLNTYFYPNDDGEMLIIGDQSNSSLIFKKYSATGSHMFTLGQGIPGDNNLSGTAAQFGVNSDYHFFANDDIMIADYDNNRIKLYSGYNGNWITTIGNGLPGNNAESSSGASFQLSNIIFPENRDYILILDSLNNTIKKYIP